MTATDTTTIEITGQTTAADRTDTHRTVSGRTVPHRTVPHRTGSDRTAAGADRSTPMVHSLPVIVVHQALRRELRLAGHVVRRAEGGDTDRARLLTRHLSLVLESLHHHHEIEDEFLWPILRARGGAAVEPIVETMEQQHRSIDRSVRTITGLIPVWSTRAEVEPRDRLARELRTLHELLDLHLDLEERTVLPLAEEHLSADEWNHIGEEARRRQPRSGRILSFGILDYEGDPAVIASMLGDAPLPVRVLLPRLARRAYRRHAMSIYGGLP